MSYFQAALTKSQMKIIRQICICFLGGAPIDDRCIFWPNSRNLNMLDGEETKDS